MKKSSRTDYPLQHINQELSHVRDKNALVEVAGFHSDPDQMKLKALLLTKSKADGGAPLSTLTSHEAIEKAAGYPIPRSWTSNGLFMAWLRDEGEGEAKAELLYQRCIDKALEVVGDVSLSDKDLAALLKLSAELTGRSGKGPVAKKVGPSAVNVPSGASREDLKKQLHDWALSEGYTPPPNNR